MPLGDRAADGAAGVVASAIETSSVPSAARASVTRSAWSEAWTSLAAADASFDRSAQAVDSFFVRLGDLTAAFVVFAGTAWLALDSRGFAVVNLCLVAVWLALAVALVRWNRRLTAAAATR